MSKLRIGIWHNLPSGGGKRAMFEHIRGLVAHGYDVEVWCPSTADTSYLPLNGIVKENVLPLTVPIPKTTWPFGALIELSHARTLMNTYEDHCRACVRQMNDRGIELLLANPCERLACPSIARFFEGPSIVYLQEPNRSLYEAWLANWLPAKTFAKPWWHPQGVRARIQDWALVQSSREKIAHEIKNATAFSQILVNSRFSRENLLRAYNLDSSVCYLGIDTNLFHRPAPIKEPYVVGLGSFQGGKGIDRAICAIATIEADHRPDLVWIGNWGQESVLQGYMDQANKCGVKLIPRRRIPDEELVDIVSSAAVMLYTSRLEPFGFAPLEANACGTAVVGIAEGGIRETIVEGVNGFLVDNDNPVMLGAHVREICSDLRLAGVLGATARHHVQNTWTWAAANGRLCDAINAMTRTRHTPTLPLREIAIP